jgi:hypothetical protein
MKTFMVVLLILAWLIAMYFGWIHFVGKSMSTTPEVDSTQSDKQKTQQTQKAEELREEQKQLMLDRQTRMRDLQRR